jgi:hypothetical protein
VLSVSDEEFDNNKLDYRDRSKGAYWAVFRPFTFEYKGKRVTDRFLVVKSETKMINDRKSMDKAIKKIEGKLKHIEAHLDTRKYKDPAYVKYMAKKSVEA